MSLNAVYQNAKKDKKDPPERVVYEKHANELRGDIETLSLTVARIQADIAETRGVLKEIESLDMKGFTDKHARMKTSYNDLVSAYNQSQSELTSIVADMAKRLNDLESRLNL